MLIPSRAVVQSLQLTIHIEQASASRSNRYKYTQYHLKPTCATLKLIVSVHKIHVADSMTVSSATVVASATGCKAVIGPLTVELGELSRSVLTSVSFALLRLV